MTNTKTEESSEPLTDVPVEVVETPKKTGKPVKAKEAIKPTFKVVEGYSRLFRVR